MNTKLNVLHVEDDPIDAALIQEMLNERRPENSQHTVTHVVSLKDALKSLSANDYNIALVDLRLSDVVGLDNVIALKNQNPDLPIVVLTGMDDEEIAMKSLSHGAQEFLVKGHADAHVLRYTLRQSIQRKQVERTLFKSANYDEMTSLPNRRLFKEHVENKLLSATRWGNKEILMFIDLDKFKQVNDQHGHEIGNEILSQVSARIRNVVRASDLVARYGGDEFVIMLDHRSDQADVAAKSLGLKLSVDLAKPYFIADMDNPIHLTASIGIALFPQSGPNFKALINSADTAMYDAKAQGGNQFTIAKPNFH